MIDDVPDTSKWLPFESSDAEDVSVGTYADYDEQSEMSAEDAAKHLELVRRVGEEFGFPLSDWVPSLPTRHGSHVDA